MLLDDSAGDFSDPVRADDEIMKQIGVEILSGTPEVTGEPSFLGARARGSDRIIIGDDEPHPAQFLRPLDDLHRIDTAFG